jgi:hypothetical protein
LYRFYFFLSHFAKTLFTLSRTDDGEMFVVKDPDLFASKVIPQYFDHNKFTSFARQLNFYGFRKMQAKPIRNADFDTSTSKHVTFYNEKFKRGRCDLLKEIQRSTRGGHNNPQDQQKEIEALKTQVADLEQCLEDTKTQMEERVSKLELDMLGQMEQVMLVMQQYQQTAPQFRDTSAESGAVPGGSEAWDSVISARRSSTTSNFSMNLNLNVPIVSSESLGSQKAATPPTLPPHPKQKQLPAVQGFPMNIAGPPSRLNSLRGISRGMSRGMSVESSSSAVVMRNSWEDKFFSMLMLGETEAGAAAAANAYTEQQAAAAGGANAEAAAAAPMSEDVQVNASLAASPGGAPAEPPPLGIPKLSPTLSERSLSSVSSSDLL